MKYANRNELWSNIFVDELLRAGVTAACIAPGSRSMPLAFAFANRPEIKVYSLLDERGAAFFTLGLGQTSRRPAALVCTSGTAAANFLPAIIEASQSEIPMLVLTADRPLELQHSGSNQTIDQIKLYGDYVRWFVQVPSPEANPSAHLLSSLRTMADRAVAASLGLNGAPGPVHLNFPFRKPLEPTTVPGDLPPEMPNGAAPPLEGRSNGAPFVQIQTGWLSPTQQQIGRLADQIQSSGCGLIVCGPRCPGGEFPAEVVQLAEKTGFPVLADSLSGVRFGAQAGSSLVLGGYETFLSSETWAKNLPVPELVLRFGDLPVSAALGSYLAQLPARTRQIAIGAARRWADDMFVLNEVIHVDSTEILRQVDERLTPQRESAFLTSWLRADAAAWEAVAEVRRREEFEGAVLADVVENLPDGTLLYVSNSLPIRHLDQFARPRPATLRIFANRGASGIDGTISSALGVAAGSEGPLVLVTGDLSFYHDLNSLLALKHPGVRATIVLIHNDGGGIFRRLPAAQFDPPFTELLLASHGLDFAPAVEMFGAEYWLVNGMQNLGAALKRSIRAEKSHILNIHTDSARGEQVRTEIIQHVGRTYSPFPDTEQGK